MTHADLHAVDRRKRFTYLDIYCRGTSSWSHVQIFGKKYLRQAGNLF